MADTMLVGDHPAFRIALAAVVIASFGIYSGINARGGKADILNTRFDDGIPFLPVFSVPYLLYLPFLFFVMIYGTLVSPYYANIAASAIATQLIAAAVYHVCQTHVPRPVLSGKDLFSRLTAFIYRHDRPYSCFPSLHVSYSLLCLYWSWFLFPTLFPFLAIFVAAVILSTLFIKQHTVADVIAGASLTTLVLLILGV